MRAEAVGWLACPDCSGQVALISTAELADFHVLEGTLRCEACGQDFPVAGGVPRMLSRNREGLGIRERTAARFALEWKYFHDFGMAEEQESFETWLHPRKPGDLEGLVVLDAGCGMGRHLVLAALAGARAVVGIDLGDAVAAAFANTRHLPNVCVVQGDICLPPLAPARFDAGMSIGVLHHLPDPTAGFVALARCVRPGGWLHLWLYGREGNGLVLWLVEPLRRLTSRLPFAILNPFAALLASPFFFLAKTFYRRQRFSRLLPYGSYLNWISAYSFRKVWAIVLDQLVTPVTHYLTRQEIEIMWNHLSSPREEELVPRQR